MGKVRVYVCVCVWKEARVGGGGRWKPPLGTTIVTSQKHLTADVASANRFAIYDKWYLGALFAGTLACFQDSAALQASRSIVQKGLVCDVGNNKSREVARWAADTSQGVQARRGHSAAIKHFPCDLKKELEPAVMQERSCRGKHQACTETACVQQQQGCPSFCTCVTRVTERAMELPCKQVL
jgi:hypothetical protein